MKIYAAMRESFLYLYAYFFFVLLKLGLKLPGSNFVLRVKNIELVSRIKRQLVIYNLKNHQYFLSWGPYKFRVCVELFVNFIYQNSFIIKLFGKVFLALLLILVPFFLFILLRGVLPVPDRIPYHSVQTSPHKKSFSKVLKPYTAVDIFHNDIVMQSFLDQKILSDIPGAVNSKGVMNIALGYYPYEYQVFNGFFISESNPLILKGHGKPLYSKGSLKLKYFGIKTSHENSKCKLQISYNRKILYESDFEVSKTRNRIKKNKLFFTGQKSFSPKSISLKNFVSEIGYDLFKLPRSLTIKVINESKIESESNKAECLLFLEEPQFHLKGNSQEKTKNIILIAVDSLRYNEFMNSKFSHYFNKKLNFLHKTSFYQHRAQSNEFKESIISILSSKYPSEFQESLANEDDFPKSQIEDATLPKILSSLGYQTSAIGKTSDFSGLDVLNEAFAFDDVYVSELTQYGTRLTSEHAIKWVENNQSSPFFLFIAYNTFKSPYKAPFSNINFLKALKLPFILNLKRSMYKGLISYFDKELYLLLKRLYLLCKDNEIHIILTSSNGVQFDFKNYGLYPYVESKMEASYGGSGKTLFDEDIHVPLVYLSNTKKFLSSQNHTPSSHLDLLPTFWHIAKGYDDARPVWRGQSLFKKRMPDNFFYLEAGNYSGLFYRQKNSNIAYKYILQSQKESAQLYQKQSFFRKKFQWLSKEQFTQVDLKNNSEKLLSTLPNQDIRNLRRIYYGNHYKNTQFTLKSNFSGVLNLKVAFSLEDTSKANRPHILNYPATLSLKKKIVSDKIFFNFEGHMERNDSIVFSYHLNKILDFSFKNDIEIVTCAHALKFRRSIPLQVLNSATCLYLPRPENLLNKSENYVYLEKAIHNVKNDYD